MKRGWQTGGPLPPRPWFLALAFILEVGCRRGTLLPRGEGEAVVVMELDAAAAPGAGLEVPATSEGEPNNTAAQAERVYLAPWPLLPGAPVGENAAAAAAGATWAVQGELATGGDVDTYRVTLVPPEGLVADAGLADAGAGAPAHGFATLRVELAPATSGLTNAVILEGRLAGGGRVVQLSTKGERVSVPNAGLWAGSDLLLTVSRASRKAADAVPYKLLVVASTPGAGDELEPNGELAKATAVASNTATIEAVGYLGWRQDTDWFAVTFPAMPPDTGLSIDLQLPAEGMATLAVSNDPAGQITHGYARATTDKLQLRGVAVPSSGRLFVRVQNAGPAVLLQRYRLTLAAVPVAPGFELEPNDVPSNAFAASAATLLGFVHPVGDVDVLKVCERAGMPFSVQSPARLDLTVTVMDALGAELVSFPVAPGKSAPSPIPGVAGCFLIQVREKAGKSSNSLEPYAISFGG